MKTRLSRGWVWAVVSVYCVYYFDDWGGELWAHDIIVTTNSTQIAKFMGPTWGPPGSCRLQMGPTYFCLYTPWIFKAWISRYAHSFPWVVITHPCPNNSGGLFKPPPNLGHGWIFTTRNLAQTYLIIHALYAMKISLNVIVKDALCVLTTSEETMLSYPNIWDQFHNWFMKW